MNRQTIIGLGITAAILIFILELVRSRRLREEYSLLWLLTGSVLIVLNVWSVPLDWIASVTGIYRPTVMLVVAVAFFLIILLHYSTVLTRMADQNKELAQELALLRQELEQIRDQSAPEQE
jgi:hypothetical protein